MLNKIISNCFFLCALAMLMFPVTSLAQTSFQTTTPFQTLELDADGIITGDKLSVTALSGNGQVLAISWPDACVRDVNNANPIACVSDMRNFGYVFIYTKGTDRQWIKASTVSMTEVDTRFGASLGISYDGSTIAVGAPEENGEAGAVRIFIRGMTGGVTDWTEQVTLEPGDIEAGDEFGDSVALDDTGDILAVGAPQDNGASDVDIDSGAVYVFTRNGDTWTQQTTVLRSQDPTRNVGDEGNFGNSVALNSNGLILAVGAPADPVELQNRVGRVHVFSRSSVTDVWGTPSTVLAGENPDSGNLFGASIALNAVGDILAIGSSEENNSAGSVSIPSVGAVYIFKRTGSTWIQPPERILPVPLIANRRFGMLVDLNRAGNRLVTNEVGVPSSGAVYLYGFDKFLDTWTELSIIFRTQNLGGVYGHGITVSDDNLVVTSRNFDHDADVYELDSLISDLIIVPASLTITTSGGDNSGTVNVNLENTPSSPVTVTADAQAGLTVSPASLDFTNTDPQTFTVTVVDDGVFIREQSAVTFRADNYLSTRLAVTIDSQPFTPPTPSTIVSVGGFTNNIPAFSRDGQVMVIGTEDLSTVGVYVINTSGTWELAQTIMSSNPTLSLGTSSDGSMIAIGVSGEDRVDIYSQGPDGMWSLQTSVVGTEVSAGGHSFGASVALDDTGSILAVGADSVSPASPLVPGMVYVFQLNGKNWTQQTILRPIVPDGIPANEAREGNFGSAVALSGNGLTLVVGSQTRPAINFDPVTGETRGTYADAGAVYVYSRTSDTESWDDPNIFAGSDTDNVDFFGIDVALNTAGNVLAVGASGRAPPTTDTDSIVGSPMDSSGPGAVYIFELEENGSWSQQGLPITPSGISDDNVIRFGESIDLNGAGDRLVAGAPNFGFIEFGGEIVPSLVGAVYLYGFDDFSDRWHELNMIAFEVTFGSAGNFVALSDEYLAAGLLLPTFAGAADVFELDSLISDLIIDPPDLRIAVGGTGTVNVRLEDTPNSPVTITATAGEGLTIDPLELTFSGTVARAFTVTAADDLINGQKITVNFSADGYITKQLQITIGSADRFLRFPADMVNVQEQSDGVPTTVSVSITDPDTIPTATSATVAITGQNLTGLSFPQFDIDSMVLLTTLRDDGLAISVGPDGIYTGNRDVTVMLSAPGYTPATMTLRIIDASMDQPPAITVNPLNLSLPAGSFQTFDIRIDSARTSTLNVTVTAGEGITVSPAKVVFGSATGDTLKTVTVTADSATEDEYEPYRTRFISFDVPSSEVAVLIEGQFNAVEDNMDANFGRSISLSGNGQVMAVGTISDMGRVDVYTKNDVGYWVEMQTLAASNAELDDEFGSAIAINYDGSTIAIGAPAEDSTMTGTITGTAIPDADENSDNNAGAVYIFTRAAREAEWTQQTYIKASNASVGANFGVSVALSDTGDILAIGADEEREGMNDQSGAVYVFIYNGPVWSEENYLKVASGSFPAFTAADGSEFGASVSLSGDGTTLAIGSPEGCHPRSSVPCQGGGIAYVFTTAADWGEDLQGPVTINNNIRIDGPVSDFDNASRAGSSVGLNRDGTTLVLGAEGGVYSIFELDDTVRLGHVRVFTKQNDIWEEKQRIDIPNLVGNPPNDRFGASVAIKCARYGFGDRFHQQRTVMPGEYIKVENPNPLIMTIS